MLSTVIPRLLRLDSYLVDLPRRRAYTSIQRIILLMQVSYVQAIVEGSLHVLFSARNRLVVSGLRSKPPPCLSEVTFLAFLATPCFLLYFPPRENGVVGIFSRASLEACKNALRPALLRWRLSQECNSRS